LLVLSVLDTRLSIISTILVRQRTSGFVFTEYIAALAHFKQTTKQVCSAYH